MRKKVPSLFSASGPHAPADWIKETFVVFSQGIPSENLGFVDKTASSIEVTIGSHDFTISQSPGLLYSNADTGTTGAVLWKVTPLVAAWLIDKENFLWKESILTDRATVVELGCGISGLIGLSMAHLVTQYVLTDQSYVMKLLRQNIAVNQAFSSTTGPRKGKPPTNLRPKSNLESLILDWETDSAINVKSALGDDAGVTLLVACDCIYNDFLIEPFIQMSLDICALHSPAESQAPTVVLVAQQLRSDEVFLEWLRIMTTRFKVWRVPDECLPRELKNGSGYVVHLALKMEDHKS